MTEEPSVLDYVKSKLAFWKKNPLELQPFEEREPSVIQSIESLIADEQGQDQKGLVLASPKKKVRQPFRFNWLALAAIILALIAQATLEPGSNQRQWTTGAVLYALSALLLIAAN